MICTILGCGSSTGVPVPYCSCSVCQSSHPKNNRLRASVWIQTDKNDFLIDTSADLRFQILRAKKPKLDAILFTHPHADHMHGLDDIKVFSFKQKKAIPVFLHAWTHEEMTVRFPYLFSEKKPDGGAVANLDLRLFDPAIESFEFEGDKIIPISLVHGKKECIGYRIQNLAYVTDCNEIPNYSLKRLENCDVLILDCLRLIPHKTHFHLEKSLQIIDQLKPKKTYLTHLGHEIDYEIISQKLPSEVYLAFDGLEIIC